MKTKQTDEKKIGKRTLKSCESALEEQGGYYREENEMIRQLKKDIKLWKVISEGIDFDDLKKICDLERQNISLKQQLADVEKEIVKYHNGIPDGSSCDGCIDNIEEAQK